MSTPKKISDLSAVNVETPDRDIENFDKTFWYTNVKRLPVGFLRNGSVPIKNLRISSIYGWRSIGGKTGFHRGVDISVPTGTKLYFEGNVVYIDNDGKGAAGKYVDIERGGFLYRFMHLDTINIPKERGGKGIRVGMFTNVNNTEIGYIGTTGNSGRSTGPHLHFQVHISQSRNNSHSRNPIAFLFLHDLEIKVSSNGSFLRKPAVVPGDFSSRYDFVHDRTWYDDRKYDREAARKSYNQAKLHGEVTDKLSTDEHVVERKKWDAEVGDAEGKLAAGIWQITNLIIDRDVENKQVIDSSISSLQGSLINYFRKICQMPFVEFGGDTFGNQYYWYAKRPPFDRDGFERLLDNAAINVDESEVVSCSLSFSDGSDVYSWYQLMPTMEVLGMSKTNYYLSSIFFPEFAEVWGSKPLVVQSNYYEYKRTNRHFAKEDKKAEDHGTQLIRQSVRDLKYLIESNAYNAFARRGTITLIGDRRFKRGMAIIMPNREVFYIDAVSNNYSVTAAGINRTTTLSVSHGMFLDGITGADGGYFDIIDFGSFNIKDVTLENVKEKLSKWKVNREVFDNMIKKMQILL